MCACNGVDERAHKSAPVARRQQRLPRRECDDVDEEIGDLGERGRMRRMRKEEEGGGRMKKAEGVDSRRTEEPRRMEEEVEIQYMLDKEHAWEYMADSSLTPHIDTSKQQLAFLSSPLFFPIR